MQRTKRKMENLKIEKKNWKKKRSWRKERNKEGEGEKESERGRT